MAFKVNFNGQTLGEEIANAVSHGIGALLAITGTVVMIVTACFMSDTIGIVSAALYGAFTILLYMFSTIYHSLTNTKAKRVFQIFDHCSIFLMILGSYIPISLCLIRGALGWTLFGITVFLSVIGIVFNSIDLKRWHKLSMILYVLMGWSVVFMFKDVVSKVPVEKVVDAAKDALYTGNIGDGKMFIYDVENVVKVRTGEQGYDALQGEDY